MKPEEEELIDGVVADIFKEIGEARKAHGPLPDDLIHCAAIIAEEAGEVCQATLGKSALDLVELTDLDSYKSAEVLEKSHRKQTEKIYNEACQTAAMAISLMMKLKGGS